MDREALDAAEKAVAEFGRNIMNEEVIELNAKELAEVAVGAYLQDIVRQLELQPCADCTEEDQMTAAESSEHHVDTEQGMRHEPYFQNGQEAIVLGAHEGNIGGSIAEALCAKGWIAQEDDCFRIGSGSRTQYLPPVGDELNPYEACIITLGATHMEPFSSVSHKDMHKVLYGSLELPLECARRYVQARKATQLGGPHKYPGAPGYNPSDPGDCFTSDCVYGCGAWMGPSRSGSRPGSDVDPFGLCPKAPSTDHHSTIIFIGSYAHNHPFTHCTSYCAAKAGLDMAARSLAWELMPEGFDVHIIHPHHVSGTPMTDEVLKGMQEGVHKMTPKQAREYQRKDLRMPNLLTPQDIAKMVVLILENPVMRWVSGTNIELYGGVR